MRGGIVFEGQAIPECRTSCTIFSLSTRSDPLNLVLIDPTDEGAVGLQLIANFHQSSKLYKNLTSILRAVAR